MAAEPNDADPAVDANPYESPAAPPSRKASPSPSRRAAVIATGVVLTPLAAFVGGFCSCSAMMTVTGPRMYPIPTDREAAIGLVGAALAGGLVVWRTRAGLKALENEERG